MAEQLAAVLTPVLGPVTVEGLAALTGGASRSTWEFDAISASGRRSLILRRAPAEDSNASMKLEALAQRAAGRAGAPVPTTLIADDSAAALGHPFLICDKIAGETLAPRIERRLDDLGRAELLRQCASALAAIHRADPADLALSNDDQLHFCRTQWDALHVTSAPFEWAFRWLAAHRPAPTRARLVHGDFRMGNLVVDGTRLAAVLDWELVHLGDTTEDVAWFCLRAWRFGAPAHRGAGGLGSIDDFLASYQQAAGVEVEADRFAWWLVLGTLRWGIICCMQARRHLSGLTRSVELATIGRRVCETEWDLLYLLDGQSGGDTRHATAGNAAGPSRPPTYARRPTAADLIGAVAEFLEGDVRAATEGQVNFHARVAANALRIVERELTDPSGAAPTQAMAALEFTNEETLAAAIRAGDLDDRAPALTACLRSLVQHRLAIDHPGYDND